MSFSNKPGVKGPVIPDRGTPFEIPVISELRMYTVVYYDAEGRKHISTLGVIGDKDVVLIPNGDEWTKSLKPAPAKIAEELMRRIHLKDVEAATARNAKVDPTERGT